MTENIFDKYLINGEKVVSGHGPFKHDIFLAITNKRLLAIDDIKSNVYDIKFGNIVSVNLESKFNKRYIFYFILCLLSTIANVFLYKNTYDKIFNNAAFVSIIFALVSLILYLFSKQSKISITAKDTKEHEFILKGRRAKDEAVNVWQDIRNAAEENDNISK